MNNNTTYKDSPVGRIPRDWEIRHFEDISDIDKDSLKGNTPKDYQFEYVSLSDVDSDIIEIETSTQVFETAPSRARRIVKKGDILMSTVRPNLQGFSLIRNEVKDLIASTGFAVISTTKCSSEFLYQYLFSSGISKQFYQLLVGSNYPAINSSDVKRLKLPLPPLAEQTRIAEVLSTWDKAISNVQATIEQVELRNKWLMQELLSGKRRLKGFEKTAWENKKLSNCLNYIAREVPKPSSSFFALGIRCHAKGIFHKNDFEPEDLAMDVLYEVKENDLIVNITFAWEHAIAIAGKQDDGGLVSHRFPTYTFKTKNAIPEFFRYFILQKKFKYQLDLISPGGAGRNRVMSKKDFPKIEVTIPSVEEQKAIANILDSAFNELSLLRNKREMLKEQKKGLMQVLLTGKKRLKIKELAE